MAKINIKLSSAEITLEFRDTEDLREQLEKIDFARIDSILSAKRVSPLQTHERPVGEGLNSIPEATKDLGTINLLRISDGGQDAVKLAVYLAANKLPREEIRKATGVTILSS
ncbi:MAG: hypothetical protein KGI33_11350 [Thaumarchaeota archaeon]|nr:hypothetical protein [Nitrososphaerota archaeon]